MNATAYADTNLLASLYLADANTPAALAAVSAAGAPLLLTSWQQFELENAFQLRLFRRESTRADLASAEAHLIQDISAGMVAVVALQLKATRFLTLNTRQRALARAAGLRTT